MKLHNRPYLKSFRKSLRNNSTSAEAYLWKLLKNKQVGGLKFRRQHSVGNYILDFYCPELNLAIELDGEIHSGHVAEQIDRDRDEYLSNQNIKILHFENRWVFEAPQDIIEEILEVKENNHLPFKRRRNELV